MLPDAAAAIQSMNYRDASKWHSIRRLHGMSTNFFFEALLFKSLESFFSSSLLFSHMEPNKHATSAHFLFYSSSLPLTPLSHCGFFGSFFFSPPKSFQMLSRFPSSYSIFSQQPARVLFRCCLNIFSG